MSQKNVDQTFLVRGLPDEIAEELLREKLEDPYRPSLQEVNCSKDCGAITGAYTEEEAEQWIAKYEEAIPEVPRNNS